ncbi:hypothetical protein IAU59_003177 [Kwoniella sp. CBS 9459]
MPVKRAAAGSSSEQKRTRFDASASRDSPSGSTSEPEDNDLLEEDLPQGAKREKQRAKRKLRDQEGYGSDSSNDEESVVPSRRPGAKAEEEEDDDVDMFADDVDEKGKGKEADKGKGKGKADDFMDMSQIEGQEFGEASASGGANGGDAEDSDSGDEAQAKKNIGTGLDGDMGTDITPFNMKSEMTEGRFTADGEEYMENDRDPNDRHDMWLEDLDKDEIKKARRAHKERERLEKEREDKENSQSNKEREIALLRDAVALMERGETVLEALQRFGKQVEDQKKKEDQAVGGGAAAASTKKKSWVERQKERKKMMAVDQEQVDPTHTSNPFTNLTNIVSSLTTTVQIDVYSLSRESIQRMLPRKPDSANGNSRSTVPPPPPEDKRAFQYRFSMAYVRSLPEAQRPVEREVFGPFPVQQLKQWRNTGFFGGPACENVELRPVDEGAEGSTWGTWDEIVG